MKCDFCGNDASMEIVVFVNGEAKKIRLCSSCYKEKLQEMAQQLPKELGGNLNMEQLQEMLNKMQELGGFQGMEIHVPDGAEGLWSSNMNPFAKNGGIDVEDAIIVDDDLNKDKKQGQSARDLVFNKQLEELRKKRAIAIRNMEAALQAEDYESCIRYRDEIERTGEDLVRLNEERKDPYGV